MNSVTDCTGKQTLSTLIVAFSHAVINHFDLSTTACMQISLLLPYLFLDGIAVPDF